MYLLLLSILISFPSWLFAETLRSDLQTPLQNLLCKNPQVIPSTLRLWQEGIFDTQLDAAFIRSGDDRQPLIAQDVAQIAEDQARAKNHRGYAYGLCSPQQAWIVSSPAGSALMQRTNEGLKFDIRAMRERCKTVSIHYAKAQGGPVKHLLEINSEDDDNLVVHPELLAPGTLGLTCHPSDRKKEGPELWALVPIQNMKADRIPFFSSLHKEGTGGLIQWIQDVRAAQGLKVLKTENSLLRNFANQLVADTSIRHPHAQLLQQRDLLAKKKIQILGENRVKAANSEQMAWLLWYSPTHRQLLLHKDASALGFDVAPLQHEKLLVLVLAKI